MRTIATVVLMWLVTLPVAASQEDRFMCAGNGTELQQLRIYEVNRSNRDAFHARFQDHALRIMQRHGFKVIDMWESDAGEKLEFIYLLSWPDAQELEMRWNAFLADPEWIEIKKRSAVEHGELVYETSGRPLRRVSYSPACR